MIARERIQEAERNVKQYIADGLLRLVYTLLGEKGRWIVVVLEAFLTHKEYEKRFGYC